MAVKAPTHKERVNPVRVSAATSALIDSLAKSTGKSKVAVLDEAVAAMADKLFWEGFEACYASPQGDAIQAEVAVWEGVSDGLPPIDEETRAWAAAERGEA